MATKVNEGTELALPLKNIIGLVVFASVAMWAYFGITERLTFLEHNYQMMAVEVEENDDWIDSFEPPKSVQETVTQVRKLETQVELLKREVEYLQLEINRLRIVDK